MNNDVFDPGNPADYRVQEANNRARTAEAHENAARGGLETQKHANQANVDLIVLLRDKVATVSQRADALEKENARLQSERDFFEQLLSLPMQDIAEKDARFRTAYHEQQLLLAKWVLSQKAYAETAMQIGLDAGKTAEDVVAIYKDSIVSVLANATQHGNDAVTTPVLKANVDNIINANKRQ